MFKICTTGFRNQHTLDDIYDKVGHGTAVVSLISKGISVDEIEVYVIRLFNDFLNVRYKSNRMLRICC